MNILYITYGLPYPPVGGAKVRDFYLLNSLSKHHSVTCVCLLESADVVSVHSPLPFPRNAVILARSPFDYFIDFNGVRDFPSPPYCRVWILIIESYSFFQACQSRTFQ